MQEHPKLRQLKDIIRNYKSVLVAFSGGVDSSFVLKIAREILGRDRVKAVTAQSPSVPARELEAAAVIAHSLDVEHRIVRTRELDDPRYRKNPTNRCYFCKTELYEKLATLARQWRLDTICNGANVDDLVDHRPGLRAADEHGIKSPLVEAGLGKEEVRGLSRSAGLDVWDKPASPCLSSRLPYGSEVTPEKLNQIEAAENFLKDLGFRVVRCRHFGSKARLELGKDELVRIMDVRLRNKITAHIVSLGFKTVCLEPYQSGRLNSEAIGSQNT